MPERKQNSNNCTGKAICPEDEGINRVVHLRFWEIDNFFKCPVVGMCITLSEQKRLLKKAGFSIKKKSPFEIHETLVASSESESLLSKRVDSLLHRKFGSEAVFLMGLGYDEFKEHFKNAFKTGDCLGALWAAASHPGLSPEVKREIFGDIHMSMHWTGEQSIRLKQKLAGQQKELGELRKNIKDAARLRRSIQKENKRLKQNRLELKGSLAAAEKENNKLKEDLAGLESKRGFTEIERENRDMKEKYNTLLVNDMEKQCQIISLREKNMQLSLELEQQQDLHRRFKKEAREFIGEVSALSSCDETCPSFNLCQKRILIVGGITRMESMYRELIESNGGVFDYHDGYMKKGVKRLEFRLRRADVVVCPVSCNSHAACSMVKNLAKKHNKTVHMLAQSSLNAVSQVIWGTDRAAIN